ncbi:MAG: choice-of-anchor tandem repeat GloVer-containing protein, partial [Verrucomicrobiota bacterium]
MKIRLHFLFLLLACTGFLAMPAAAQTFTNLYNFTALNNGTNSDGANPTSDLILSGNALYGTALNGGSSGNGAVFVVNTDGSGFTNLYSFTALNNGTNSDGANPHASLILSGNTLYGTTQYGGTNGFGTVFAVNTNGTGFTNLYSFTIAYQAGGISLGTEGPLRIIVTNSDGANPSGGLTLSGSTLYGTAGNGGGSGFGTVFAINTNGTGFTNLYSFTAGGNDSSSAYTNSGGIFPLAGLILSGNTLYGTAEAGGSGGNGTVFAINTNGTGFTNLYNFTGGSDGADPQAGLILSGNTLYGTASDGGSGGNGTLFALNTDGTGFTNLHTFTNSPDGANPHSGLILSGNTLYGTIGYGGSSGDGAVFALSLVPPLSITETNN